MYWKKRENKIFHYLNQGKSVFAHGKSDNHTTHISIHYRDEKYHVEIEVFDDMIHWELPESKISEEKREYNNRDILLVSLNKDFHISLHDLHR